MAINDCLYRSMHAFDRVVFNDLDEFVVARWPADDWSTMTARFDRYFRSAAATSGDDDSENSRVSRRPSKSPSVSARNSSSGRRRRRYCAFSFRSAFFDPMTPPSVAYVGGSGKLITSSLNSVAYELESDIRTEIFSGVRTKVIRSFQSKHNVVDRGVLQAMWEELAGQVVHRDQLIICKQRVSENALILTIKNKL